MPPKARDASQNSVTKPPKARDASQNIYAPVRLLPSPSHRSPPFPWAVPKVH